MEILSPGHQKYNKDSFSGDNEGVISSVVAHVMPPSGLKFAQLLFRTRLKCVIYLQVRIIGLTLQHN